MRNFFQSKNCGKSVPISLFFLATNDLYVADSESSTIRVVLDGAKNGVKNICGGSRDPLDLFSYGDKDGKGPEAKLQHPLAVALYPRNDQLQLVIADSYNHKLKIVTNLKAKSPLVCTCPVQGLDEPGGLDFDSEGENQLFVADTNNHMIKKVNIETFQVTEIKIDIQPDKDKSEVDFSKSSEKIQAGFGKFDIKLQFLNDDDFTLNPEAPNGWKIEFPAEDGEKIGGKLT